MTNAVVLHISLSLTSLKKVYYCPHHIAEETQSKGHEEHQLLICAPEPTSALARTRAHKGLLSPAFSVSPLYLSRIIC